jgi:hypothetical protein
MQQSQRRAKELRAGLIKLDEQTRKDSQKQAREDLISSLDDHLTLIEEKMGRSSKGVCECHGCRGTTAGSYA